MNKKKEDNSQKTSFFSSKNISYLYYLSSVLILLGVGIGGLTDNLLLNIIYLIGAILYFAVYLIKDKEQAIRLKRLDNMNALAGIFFILSAIFKMGFLREFGANLWILAFAIASVFMIYALVIMNLTGKTKEK